MKKLLFLALLLFFLPSFSFAIGVYKAGDKLFNLAQSGLILRKTASPDGARISSVAYGEEVTVQKIDLPKKAHQVDDFKGYKIKGFWVKVKTKAGLEGYVFDGYLSSYQAPGTALVEAQSEEASCTAEMYMLGKSAKKGARVVIPKVGNQYEHYRQAFKNGASVEFNGGEGGSSQSITFEKGITVEEAYLIGKALWLKEMKVVPVFKKNVITVSSNDELWQIVVESKAGAVTLTMSHAD